MNVSSINEDEFLKNDIKVIRVTEKNRKKTLQQSILSIEKEISEIELLPHHLINMT